MGVGAVLRVRARRERGAGPVPRGEGAGRLPVDDVRGDRQDRLGRDRVAVHRDRLDLLHHGVHDRRRDVVGAVVVVAVPRELPLGHVVDDQARLVPHRGDRRVADRGEGVRDDRQARDAAAHGAHDLAVVQRHLDRLVGVAVVAVVDDVQRLDVGAHHPVEHLLVALPDLVEVQRALARDRGVQPGLGDLLPGDLVAAAVDRVEQRLAGVDAGAEELHLLAHPHRGDAAGDRCVVAPALTDLRVGLVLDRGGLDRDRGAELLVALGKGRVPEDGDVRLRGGAEVPQGLQQAEGRPGDQRAAVLGEAGVGPGRPVGVAGEDLVVVDGAQEADDPQLDHERVDDLLRLGLGEGAGGEIPLDVHVQEAREAADGHRGAVLALHRGEIGHVGPLHGLLGGRRGAAQVQLVDLAEPHELLQRLDLLGVLLAVTGPVLGEAVTRDGVLRGLLLRDQEVRAVEGEAAVVADDAAAAVGVGQAGDDVAGAGSADPRGVDVEDAVVVGLAVLGEDLLDPRIGLLARLPDRGLDHAPAAAGHHGALERHVGLEADDHVVVLADVPGGEGVDVGGGLGVDVVDAPPALLREVGALEVIPEPEGLLCGAGEEGGVAGVGGVVAQDEVAHVDRLLPRAGGEPRPGVARGGLGGGTVGGRGAHDGSCSRRGPAARVPSWMTPR